GAGLLALWSSEPSFLAAMALLGVAAAALAVAPAAVVGDVVGDAVGGRGGTVVASFGMAADVGAVTGPLVAGALAESSYTAAFTSTALVLGLGLAMTLRMPETVTPGAPAPEAEYRGDHLDPATRQEL
ncbi:MAG: MFS transporter, partial [Acidimicrobiia bacterium]